MYKMEQNIQKEKENSSPVEIIPFLPIIHKFFSRVKTYDEGIEFLKEFYLKKIYDYHLVHSRKIFYTLIIYKFGKELEYPDSLQSTARQLILYVLQNNGKENITERRRIFGEFLEEFNNFRKEDFKNYMYELGVHYHQLIQMKMSLKDYPEWLNEIQALQDKILDQVIFVKGDKEFQECLLSLSSLQEKIIKENMENAYWNMICKDLDEQKYDLLLNNYKEIKNIFLEIRDDADTKDILDEDYIRQLLEKNIFTEKTLISQVDFIFYKIKEYGIPAYDHLLDKSKNSIIEDIQNKGLTSQTIVDVFKRTMPILQNYIEIIRIYRKQIQRLKEEKK